MNGAGAARRAQVAAGDGGPDPESRVSADDHEALRLWLRLYTCTTLIERGIRTALREEFATTLPRFDLMAQLARHPDGLRMGELSQRLMVTGGSVTGLTDQLVAEGLVERRPDAEDRRAHTVRLTRRGRRSFDTMAVAHEQWVIRMLTGVSAADQRALHRLLGRVKTAVAGTGRSGEHTREDASS